jgi:hypothetical protein
VAKELVVQLGLFGRALQDHSHQPVQDRHKELNMKCLIQIDENGNFVGHPIVMDNFLQAFPNIDISNDIPPKGFAWFTRKNSPYTIANVPENNTFDSRYIKTSDTTFEDEFYIRPMTQEELDEREQRFLSTKPYPSWIADTKNKIWKPPIKRPVGSWDWDESTLSWIEPK